MKFVCIFLATTLLMAIHVGCGKQNEASMGVWSQPVEIAKSSDSLSTSFSLYRWNGSLLTAGGDAGTYVARILEDDSESWKIISKVDTGWKPMCTDPKGNRFLASWATLWSNRVDANFAVGLLSLDGKLSPGPNAALPLTKATLFPNSKPELRINVDDRPAQIGFLGGVIEEAEIRVPYSIIAIPKEGRVFMAGKAVSANGVFASSDGGRTWRSEPIFISGYSQPPVSCRTKSFYYCLGFIGPGGGPLELWSSRCSTDTASWSVPETLNKTGAHNPKPENLHAIGENDVVHVCWLDGRHETTRFSLSRPRAGNYEVAYSHRRDSDASWSKDVILSKGLRWAYAPSMSVEGNNVVVAWAGAKSGGEGRNEWNATDIYYVVSKDNGNSWSKPAQVTDGFKSGITSGRPQVALHKDVIHLFYVQGKTVYEGVSAGMVKLNLPPWPIYYQQRPFPSNSP